MARHEDATEWRYSMLSIYAEEWTTRQVEKALYTARYCQKSETTTIARTGYMFWRRLDDMEEFFS